MVSKKNLLYILLPIIFQAVVVKAGEYEFSQLVKKVEGDVIELAREVERLYKNRCLDTLKECSKNNYHECVSSFPNQVCPGGEQLGDKKCGDDITCSRLWDYSISRVSLPQDIADGTHANPTDPEVVETVCFSQKLDEWFMNKHNSEKGYWDNFGLETPPVYYGAHNGLFRIYPAYRTVTCGTFDPRRRPWYIAASSGPKNILMVLDVSGSMGNYGRIEILKEAAKRVIQTLDVGDRIAIVPFSTYASQPIAKNGNQMYVVTEENKKELLRMIDLLYADGATNIYEAFVKTFQIFEETFKKELHVDCNSAILFLTDGKITPRYDGIGEVSVINFITDGITTMEEMTGHSVFLFTYSISGEEADRLPYELSCAVKFGVWSKLEDESEIIDSLTSYYQLFALGLGNNKNENFTAWVEPYLYADGVSTGTTVSAPVYDRDKDPHLFLGVVGLDFRLAAIDIALGADKGNMNALDRVVRQSTAKCPSLDSLTECELESYRHRGTAGNAAMCSNNCSGFDFVTIEPEKCTTISDYPTDLWANTDELYMSYEERACCLVGETKASEVCDGGGSSSSSIGIIVGLSVAIGVVLAIIIIVVRRQRRPNTSGASTPGNTVVHKQGKSHIPIASATIVQVPPVSPPRMNPNFDASAPMEDKF